MMPNDHTQERRERAHQRVWELLPWHLTERLDSAETKLVDDHLAECERCREELAHGRALARALREEAAVVPSPHPGGFARLLARVDALAATPARRTLRARAAQLRRTTPAPVRRLVLAQAAALLLLATALAWRTQPWNDGVPSAPGVFRTLSSGPETPSARPALRVVFAPETTESEIRALLAQTGAQLVGGPSPMGAYLIGLTSPSTEPLSLVLSHLRSHSRVRFVEPVAGATASGAPQPAATDAGSGE